MRFRKRKEEKEKTINFESKATIPSKFEAIILRKINNGYTKIGQMKIKNTATSFRFKTGDKSVTFIIKENIKVAYSDGKKSYLFYDFDSGILAFEKERFPLTIAELDDMISKNVLAGLFSKIKGSLEKTEISGTILKYIVVLGLGLTIGWILHEAVYPPVTAKILEMLI